VVIAAAITGLKSRRPAKRPAGGCIGSRAIVFLPLQSGFHPLLRPLLILTGENGWEIIARTLPRSTLKQMLLSYQNLIVRHFYAGNTCCRKFGALFAWSRDVFSPTSRSFRNFCSEILCNLFLTIIILLQVRIVRKDLCFYAVSYPLINFFVHKKIRIICFSYVS
jgi:hypothetical protein